MGRGHAGAHTARGQRYHDPHWAGTGFDEAANAGLAFAIKPGDRLYLPPNERVRIW